jgi:hypothetical protein
VLSTNAFLFLCALQGKNLPTLSANSVSPNVNLGTCMLTLLVHRFPRLGSPVYVQRVLSRHHSLPALLCIRSCCRNGCSACVQPARPPIVATRRSVYWQHVPTRSFPTILCARSVNASVLWKDYLDLNGLQRSTKAMMEYRLRAHYDWSTNVRVSASSGR